MKAKSVIGVVLLAFALASVVYLVVAEVLRKGPGAEREISNPPAASKGDADTAPQLADRVIVYYFHGAARCMTCRKIEAYTKEAVEKGFAQALRDERLQWQVVNVEAEGSRHFVKDYNLFTKSVVVSEWEGGKEVRWKRLDKIWEFVGNKEVFISYIHDEVGSHMKGN